MPSVSIRAPREGSDKDPNMVAPTTGSVSIRAPREGSDALSRVTEKDEQCFNPRPP